MFNLVKQGTISSIDRLLDGTGYDEPLPFGFLKLKPYPIPQQEGQFDLALEVLYSDKALKISLRYCTDIFKLETIERMGTHYIFLLSNIVDNPNQHLWDLSLNRSGKKNNQLFSPERRSERENSRQSESCISGKCFYRISETRD